MKLFIGGLPHNFTKNELNALFGSYGNVVESKLVMDNFTGHPRGFGFVEMATRGEGHKAMEDLNGKEYKYRQLVCSEATPQKKRGRRNR